MCRSAIDGVGAQRTTSRLKSEGAPVADLLIAPHPHRPEQQQQALVWNDLDWDDKIPPFLDACYIWAVGCTPSESFELIKCARQGAAKRFLEPVPELTHIIVGSELSSLDADLLLKVTADYKSAVVVNLEWLKRSVARREILPADARFLLTSAAINELINKRVCCFAYFVRVI